MAKKKILFLGRFAPPVHGAAVMNENYFSSLSKDKRFIVKKIKINYSSSLDQLGEVSFKKFLYTLSSYFKLNKELIFFRPDLVYFEIAPKGTAFFRDSLYALFCKLFMRKIIFQLHAKGVKKFSSKNILIRSFYKLIFRETKVVLLSNLLYPDVEGVIAKNQIEILPNGIKDEITSKEFEKIIKERLKNKKPKLLFLSNMIESKGPLDVLDICNELSQKKIQFECNFIGKFQDKTFEKIFFKKLKELKLSEKCKYLGPLYGEEKLKVLARSNYLLFPTKYAEECFPLVVLESFMYVTAT